MMKVVPDKLFVVDMGEDVVKEGEGVYLKYWWNVSVGKSRR